MGLIFITKNYLTQEFMIKLKIIFNLKEKEKYSQRKLPCSYRSKNDKILYYHFRAVFYAFAYKCVHFFSVRIVRNVRFFVFHHIIT